MLERHVEIRQDQALGHERHDLVDGRIRIDVVQARPDAELAQAPAEVEQMRAQRRIGAQIERVAAVDAVGGRVLADDEELLDARVDEVAGLADHFARRTAHEAAAQVRDDAERAVVIAPLADLEVGVVLGREAHAAGGHQIAPGLVGTRQMGLDHRDDVIDGVGARDAEHLRAVVQHVVAAVGLLAAAEAAADDDAAVFGERLGDGVKAFPDGLVDEAAGVDDHDVGVVVARADAVASGEELGDDPLRIDEGLGAAEGNETDDGNLVGHGSLNL